MKFSDLVVLSYRCQLNLVGDNGKIVPTDKGDADHAEYISQGFEIDLGKKLYRTFFGADRRGKYIQNGFKIIDGWNKIGDRIIPQDGNDFGDGLIGVYDRTNFRHLDSMVSDAVEANQDYSNAD